MPKKPKAAQTLRCVIYARVSTQEQRLEGFSIDSQLGLLREYAGRIGYEVAGEFVDAESGSQRGRTHFGKMVDRVAKGDVKAIVVEKTDRLYRNFGDLVKVDDLGVELHFVKEGQTITKDSRSSDKLIHGVKVVLAKHFSDNLREEVKKGMLEKARQGIFPSRAPLGYINVSKGPRKTIEPDPVRAPLIREIFQAYARRQVSIETAADLAREIGLRTETGASYSRSTMARTLENPIYVGIVAWDGEEHAGIHEPIVDRQLWDKVQEVMHGRKTTAGFGSHAFAYRGVMKCALCGCSITAELKKGKYVYYRCTGMRDRACPGKRPIREETLTEQFAGLLEGLTLSPSQLANLKTALKESLADESAAQRFNAERIARDTARLRQRREQLYLDRLDGKVDEDVYESLRRTSAAELAALEVEASSLASAESSYFDLGLRILELAQTASLRFKRADSETRRLLLLELINSATLEDGKVQVSLKEPFQTMLRGNVERLNNGKKKGQREDWYTEVHAIRNFLLAA